jgi:FtsP/CotA-like multicopper oxidase with cupredoxin domain
LAGPLIVVEKGKYDPTRDISVLISSPSDSIAEESAVLLNGSLTPPTLNLRRAMSYRLRLINITTGRTGMRVELKQDTAQVMWRTVAKDGADVPAALRTLRPARQSLGIGETMDVEFFPPRPGEYKLEALTQLGAPLGAMSIVVR